MLGVTRVSQADLPGNTHICSLVTVPSVTALVQALPLCLSPGELFLGQLIAHTAQSDIYIFLNNDVIALLKSLQTTPFAKEVILEFFLVELLIQKLS